MRFCLTNRMLHLTFFPFQMSSQTTEATSRKFKNVVHIYVQAGTLIPTDAYTHVVRTQIHALEPKITAKGRAPDILISRQAIHKRVKQ